MSVRVVDYSTQLTKKLNKDITRRVEEMGNLIRNEIRKVLNTKRPSSNAAPYYTRSRAPYRVTGLLRQEIDVVMVKETTNEITAAVNMNAPYAKYLDLKNSKHKIVPAIKALKPQLQKIMGKEVKVLP